MLSGKMYRFRPRVGVVEPIYLESFLRSKECQASLDQMKTGISDSGLNLTQDRFSELTIPVAPVREQQRIVAKIEELLSDLDAGVASLERVKVNLTRYKASVLKAAVEGKLTEKWREEHPNVEPASALLESILVERRASWEEEQLGKYEEKGQTPPRGWRERYKEPQGLDTGELSSLPRGWSWTSLDVLLREPLRNGHSARMSETGEGIRTLTLTAVTEGDFSEKNTKLTVADAARVRELWLEPGDILIERSNTPELVGTARLFDGPARYAVFPDLMIRARVSTAVDTRYVAIVLQSNRARVFFRGNAQGISGSMPKIDQGVVRGLSIPLPPIDEQREIAEAVDISLTILETSLSTLAYSLRRTSRLRQSILARAFSGKLVPQDPTDEPASVLLERIRAEREAQAKKPACRRRTSKKTTEDQQTFPFSLSTSPDQE